MFWLTKDMVDVFHRESLARFGGADGIRDQGLLESALARPENVHAYEPDADVFRLAAVYCHGIVKNHPFIDGNKRTGTLAAIAFFGAERHSGGIRRTRHCRHDHQPGCRRNH
jgi:death-on-curing protein